MLRRPEDGRLGEDGFGQLHGAWSWKLGSIELFRLARPLGAYLAMALEDCVTTLAATGNLQGELED
jgi:hypothetical protein